MAGRLSSVAMLLDRLVERSSLDDDFGATAHQPGDLDLVQHTWDRFWETTFFNRLRQYLAGIGHPDHPHIKTIVGESRFDRERDDELVRARLFIRMMTGSEQVPDDDDWTLRVCMSPLAMSLVK